MSQPFRSILDLSPAKRALLEKLYKENGIQLSESQRISPRTTSALPPVSYAQQRLWFLDQLLPGNPFYNIPAAIRLESPPNAMALRRSLNEIVRRHEALRTSFTLVDGEPVQMIAPVLELELPVIDLRGVPEPEREAEAMRLSGEEAQRAFDLRTGPLLRASLLQLGEADYILLLVMHHIVTDGWSMGVFFRELTELYGAFVMGRPSPLGELPIQYADFAVWQRQWLEREIRQGQVAYWKQQLRDLPVMELPTDRPRPAVQSFRGAHRALRFEPALSAGLKQLSQREGVTLFMTLLAAFQTLLHRYTSQDDIVVGSPIAGRNRAELEGLIGFFVNTLVLRTDMSGDPTFSELLRRVHQVAMGAYAHQDLPFEMLVEELQPERDLSRNPLFQVTFQLLNTPTLNAHAPDSRKPTFDLRGQTAKFDLTFDMFDLPDVGGLIGQIEYNVDLYEATTINRMAAHFTRLLEEVVANPKRKLSELPLLSEAEVTQLVAGWNDTEVEYPRDASIHELFEQQVRRTPHAIAVVYDDAQITYAELDAWASRLALSLVGLGVRPETLAGIFLERSIELVVAMLAVLKAGGAYVPLDVTYPKERLHFMIEDTGAPVVITNTNLLRALPQRSVAVVCIDVENDAKAQNIVNVLPRVRGDNLAYVMYTSGSTGRPKGVCIPHRAVNRLVCNTNYIHLGPEDRVAQMSNSSFDAATFEIWGALLSGARLIGISKSSALSVSTLSEAFKEHGITALFITTSLFNQLVNEMPEVFEPLQTLLMGGSACDVRAMRNVLKHGSPQRLVHVYGPTESTTFATWHLVTHVPAEAVTIPIGRPIANTRVYVLDRHLKPVPIGVDGELFLGGDGLARGYHNRPELTGESFVSSSFNTSDRLYRTGDRVRYLPDGSIQFLGRFDDQLKIRGFRVEPGEIESVLRGHPGVQQAVVIVREDSPEDQRLTAYIVSDTRRSEFVSELRAYASAHLPDYMVPAAFVLLKALPLSANGKVERTQLPKPARIGPETGANSVAFETDLERSIASVWQEVLGLDSVSATANFFDLGGHSLLLVRVHSRLSQLIGKDLPMTDLFRYTTIRALAQHLGQTTRVGGSFDQVRDRVKKQKESMLRRIQAKARPI